jgi:hypothetical protein
MIIAEKHANALEALHKVLIQARAMGYRNEPGVDIAEVLDDAEYLLVLIMRPEDETSTLRVCLESPALKREQFRYALEWFDRPPAERQARVAMGLTLRRGERVLGAWPPPLPDGVALASHATRSPTTTMMTTTMKTRRPHYRRAWARRSDGCSCPRSRRSRSWSGGSTSWQSKRSARPRPRWSIR